jgi:putative MATE family efflux protein
MFFQTMYNVVDTWAAGRISTEALGALGAAFPVFFLIIAVSHGTQAATNALMSHELGSDDEQNAERLAGQALKFAAWMSLFTAGLGWQVCPLILRFLDLEGEPLRLAVSYLRMLFLGTPFFVISSACNGILSSHGNTKPFRNALVVSFFLNIVLDLWFVFGGFGLPAMGFRGIALATVLLQGLSCLYMLWELSRSGAFPLKRLFRDPLSPRIQGRLIGQGFPAMVNMLTIAGGIYVYTWFAARLGTPVVAAMGISMRVEQIVLLPAVGLNTAALTLAGHGLGARNPERIEQTFHTCLRFGIWIYAIGGPLTAVFAPFWISLFTQDAQVIEIGALCLRISMLTFYAYVILFTTTSVLQGLQKPMFAIWIGLYRQVLAPILMIPFLMDVLSPSHLGIWVGVLFSVWSGVIVSFLYGGFVWNGVKKHLLEA